MHSERASHEVNLERQIALRAAKLRLGIENSQLVCRSRPLAVGEVRYNCLFGASFRVRILIQVFGSVSLFMAGSTSSGRHAGSLENTLRIVGIANRSTPAGGERLLGGGGEVGGRVGLMDD